MQSADTSVTRLGQALLTSKLVQVGEIVVVLIVPVVAILGAGPLVGESLLARHGVILVAILLMISMIWAGLRLRKQNCSHFGLRFGDADWRSVVRAVVLSLIVLVAAVVAFVVGAVVMANIVGMPEDADMTGYDYLRGNPFLLVASLLSVYVTASFGEEFIYRGFLINRMAELGSGSKAAWRLAVVISSAVFGLIHYDWGIAGMVQTGSMGLALGVSYLVVRRNLWVTILAHGYMDTILFVQLYFAAGNGVSE